MENIRKARSTDMDIYILQMDLNMLDNFWIIRYMERENILGLMEKFIMDNGIIIKWMDMVQ